MLEITAFCTLAERMPTRRLLVPVAATVTVQVVPAAQLVLVTCWTSAHAPPVAAKAKSVDTVVLPFIVTRQVLAAPHPVTPVYPPNVQLPPAQLKTPDVEGVSVKVGVSPWLKVAVDFPLTTPALQVAFIGVPVITSFRSLRTVPEP